MRRARAIFPGPVVVELEVPETPDEFRGGLMWRRSLGEDVGMLFVYRPGVQPALWMENTFVPLDMLFLDAPGGLCTVVAILENVQPMTRDVRYVRRASRAVIEVNAGFARGNGIAPGTPVRISHAR